MLSDGIGAMLFARTLSKVVKSGGLRIVDSTGRTHQVGTPDRTAVAVRVHDRPTEWRLALYPEYWIGAAYTAGTLTIEQGSLEGFLDLVCENVGRLSQWRGRWGRVLQWAVRRLDLVRTINPVFASRRRVSRHYDLSQALFELFLDADRQYSCAYFAHPEMGLDEAQVAKQRHIARKLLLSPGQRVLDIGSGWGRLALRLAREHGVDVTGITLSREQLAASNQAAREAGLESRVRFELRDYREVEGTYDRIVSVGMFEHVGPRHYDRFFGTVRDCLREDGIALLHTIGQFNGGGPINPWVAQHVFPGAYTPALSEVVPAIEGRSLWITDVEVLRLHYAETLKAWRARFQARRDRARALYDERFCRMWEFYLLACEAAFRHMSLTVFQIQMARRRDAVPLTRGYLYEDAPLETALPDRPRRIA